MAKSQKEEPVKAPTRQSESEDKELNLNHSEAVMGFAQWLASRNEVTTLSRIHDPSAISELVQRYCKVNNLPEIRKGFEKFLNRPVY